MQQYQKIVLGVAVVIILIVGGMFIFKKNDSQPMEPVQDDQITNETQSVTSSSPVTPNSDTASAYPEHYTNTKTGFSFNHKKAYTVALVDMDIPISTSKTSTVLLDTKPFPEDKVKISEDRLLTSQMLIIFKNDSKGELWDKYSKIEGSVFLKTFTEKGYTCNQYRVNDPKTTKVYLSTTCKIAKDLFSYLHEENTTALVDISSIIIN